MGHPLLEPAPGHVLAASGLCRCGWEEHASAFRWSPPLHAVVFPPAREDPGGGSRFAGPQNRPLHRAIRTG